jgi:hypothetical protein
VASLRALVDELEALHVDNARRCGCDGKPLPICSAGPDSPPTRSIAMIAVATRG